MFINLYKLFIRGLFNNNKNIVKKFFVQRPGYTKRPLGHRTIAYI